MCDGRVHPLDEIFRAPDGAGWNTESVVKWCPECGAVVVDTELDGRVVPGNVARMRFPTYKK